MVAIPKSVARAGSQALAWVSPSHYGLLPGLLVPLILVTLLAVGVIQLLESYVADAHVRGLIEQRGATRLDGLEERLKDREQALRALALAVSNEPPVVTLLTGRTPAADDLLERLRSGHGVSAIRLYTPDGAEAMPSDQAAVELATDLLMQAAAEGRPASVVTVTAEGPVVHAASPVRRPQGILGTVVLSQAVPISTQAPIDLAFYTDTGFAFTTAADPAVRETLESRPFTYNQIGDLTSALGSGYHPVARPLASGGFAVALVPTAESAAAAGVINLIRLLVTGALAFALIAVAGLLANRFHSDIRRIVGATVNIARGHYDERVEVGEIRELAHLGTAVNTMAQQLESRLGELERRASHDALTNLPNRELFLRRVDRALAGRRNDAMTVGVLFVDLDDFKVVNDTLGHRAGDELLIRVSELLLTSVRPGDTVARLGGDEFSVLLPEAQDADEVLAITERILHRLSRPMKIDGREHLVHASVGIATAAPGTMSSGTLVRNADLAMYKAKGAGKNRHAVYTPDLLQNAWERMQVETDLRQAVTGGQLRLFYQPVMDLSTGLLAGAEALMRWQHPTRGFLTPDKFIDVAEDSGLIVEMERWAHEEAGRQLHAWQELAGPDRPLTMNMNLSPKQFQAPNLAARVMEAMHLTGASTKAITLEITEQTAIDMADSNVGALQELRDAGFNLAIDDFGVGHSALTYFKQFPVNAVKVDKSFVDGLGKGDQTDIAIVQAMMSFAHALNLKVTAEGIETQEQWDALRELGCQKGQGYLFGKPLSADDFEAMLAASLDGPSDLTLLRRTLEAAKQRLAA